MKIGVPRYFYVTATIKIHVTGTFLHRKSKKICKIIKNFLETGMRRTFYVTAISVTDKVLEICL